VACASHPPPATRHPPDGWSGTVIIQPYVIGAAEPHHLKLGRYEVVRELGKGAMGIVYLAKDPLIGRLVALKTIRQPAHSDDDETKEFQQRFVREAQAAGILNHPGIVTVHDIGQDEATGMSFIAMEYVEGQNLKEVLAQGRPLSFEQIGDIIAQVADAIDFAHSKGIVHRDVKPANIILLEGNRAKITDFGIAKIATGVSNLTSTGQFLGTPNYMAPEQIKGSPVDGRTDIFSLGICLYECLTRRKPFGGDSLTSISYKIVHESFSPLREVNPQIPEGYEEVVASALAKDPARRYQRGREMANALRAVVRGDRPVKPRDPALEEATIITHNRDKIPTIELPMPDAASLAEAESYNATRAAAFAASEANAAVDKSLSTRPVSRKPISRTLDGVRKAPVWRLPIPPLLFFLIVAALALGVLSLVASLRKQTPEVPVVDTHKEARVAKERALRLEAEKLLREGKVADAYAKYAELNKLAPESDFVNSVMEKLSLMRQQADLSRQQAEQAKDLFNQGVVAYNTRNFGQAITLFQESFHLNPNDEETARYLKLAQDEDDKQREAKLAAARSKGPLKIPATGPGGQPTPQPPQQEAPKAVFMTYFDSPFTDGTMIVKVGAEVVVNEPLWEIRGIFRRRGGRALAISSPITAKNADVEIWVVVPAQQINEHRVIRGSFLPGSVHRLTVTADAKTKQFTFQLN
jgi:serine/threonine protein kinase